MKTKIELPEAAMFSVKTMAAATAFGERYWIERIRQEEIPVVRIGRSVRVLREDLQTFLEAKIKKVSKGKQIVTDVGGEV